MVLAPNVVRSIKTSKSEVTITVYDLLREVKCRENIWRVNHIDHMSRSDLYNSWRSVAHALITHFNEFDEEDQNIITTKIKNIYRVLKDNLILSIKYKKSGDKRYRIYNYGRRLDFVLQDRGLKLEEVFSQDELEEMDLFERRFKQSYAPNRNKNGNVEKAFSTEESSLCEQMYQNEIQLNNNPDYGGVIRNVQYKNHTHITKEPEQAFFDSLKPWLREMNEAQKLEFKIELLESLKKYQN